MGKKSTPQAPTPPDPVKTVEAQGAINEAAIQRSAEVNQINEVTPYGNVSWSGTIGQPDRTKTFQWSEGKQALEDGRDKVNLQMSDIASKSLSSFDLPKFEIDQSDVPTFDYKQQEIAAPRLGGLASLGRSGSSVAPPSLRGSSNTGSVKAPKAGEVPTYGGVGDSIGDYSQGAQAGKYGEAAQAQGYGDAEKLGAYGDAERAQAYGAGSVAPEYQGTGANRPTYQQSDAMEQYKYAGNSPAYNSNQRNDIVNERFSDVQRQESNKIADEDMAYYLSKMRPEFDRQQADFSQQMVDRGIPVSSAAYGDAMRQMNDPQEAALADAAYRSRQSGREQSNTMFNQDLAQRQLNMGNNIQQQQVDLSRQGLDDAENSRQNDYNLNAYSTEQQVRSDAYKNNLAGYNATEASKNTAFQNELSGFNAGEAANNVGYQNKLAGFNATEASRNQSFQNNIQAQGFNETARNQTFQNNAQAAGFNESNRNQSFQNSLASLGVNESNRNQAFSNNLASLGFNESSKSNAYQNNLANYTAQEGAKNQGYQSQVAAYGAQESSKNAIYGNQIRAQGQQQDAEAATQRNQVAMYGAQLGAEGQRYATDASIASDMDRNSLNSYQMQQANQLNQFGMAERTYGLQNSAHNQKVNEQIMTRNQPINELSALMSGQQALAMPNSPTAQYQVAPADYQGAVGLNYQGQVNNYNSQLANQKSLWGGLFGLGKAAIGKWG